MLQQYLVVNLFLPGEARLLLLNGSNPSTLLFFLSVQSLFIVLYQKFEESEMKELEKDKPDKKSEINSNFPCITTILPTYRRPILLKRAIRSILNQTYLNIRVCIYDNASGDETADVVAEFKETDDRVEYYCHEENIGAVRNYIFGVNRVETPFFSLFADDDLLLPNFYERALRDFGEYPEAMFSCASTLIVDKKGRISWESTSDFNEGLFRPPEGMLEIMNRKFISLPWTSILYRKEVLANGACFDEKLKLLSDVDWGIRCCSKFPFVINHNRSAIFSMNTSAVAYRNLIDDVWPDWQIIVDNVDNSASISGIGKQKVRKWLLEVLLNNLVLIIRDSILLRKFEQAYKGITLIQNYCENTPIAKRLFMRTKVFERVPWLRILYSIYCRGRHFWQFRIKSITLEHINLDY
jgi:glycosyltransferase involved in cell wall biosynthesis